MHNDLINVTTKPLPLEELVGELSPQAKVQLTQQHLALNAGKLWAAADKLARIERSNAKGKRKAHEEALAELTNLLAALEPLVITRNLQNGKALTIAASLKGTSCDPGTERYWSM